jgi:surface protein
MAYMLNYCNALTSIPLLDTSNVTNMSMMFYNCSGLTSVPQFDTSKVTNMSQMFYNCSGLTTVPQLNTSACTRMGTMFNGCSSLGKVEGLDFTKVTNIANMFGYSSTNNTSIKHMLLKNLGTPSNMTSYDFSKATNWGVADSTYTDARQSLVDSLLTYSYDRATAGYSTCTIKLSANSNNELTAQEITDIEAKGYTITT